MTQTWRYSSQFWFISAKQAKTILFDQVTISNNPVKSFSSGFEPIWLFWSRFCFGLDFGRTRQECNFFPVLLTKKTLIIDLGTSLPQCGDLVNVFILCYVAIILIIAHHESLEWTSHITLSWHTWLISFLFDMLK